LTADKFTQCDTVFAHWLLDIYDDEQQGEPFTA